MKNETFTVEYKNLPHSEKQHIAIRAQIIERCKISQSVFYNWICGTTSVPHWAKPRISEIMKIPQSELFPESEQ